MRGHRCLLASVSVLALAGAISATACDSTSDGLTDNPNTSGSGGGGNGGNGGFDSDGGGEGGSASASAMLAEKLFHDNVEPGMTMKCGGACHTDGTTGNAPAWLKAPTYATVKAYPGFVTDDVFASKLLTKPNHLGVSLVDDSNKDLRDKTTEWLNQEALALREAVLPSTDPITITNGVNTVDISKGGMGVDGTKITFNATITALSTDTIIEFTNMNLVTPATTGVHIVHPYFTMLPAGDGGAPVRETSDHFSNLDQTTPPATTAALGDGTLYIYHWQMGAQLKIEFTKLASGTAKDAGAATGGCKQVASFVTNAVPALQNNTCLNCHQGQNGGATGALDLTKVGTDNAAACAQSLTKVNLTNKPQSPMLLAPLTGNAFPHGGGKIVAAGGTFETMMTTWINAE
ncbi:MAG: hypothetical protein ABIP89_06615 [Polyangiaceae bacterium]